MSLILARAPALSVALPHARRLWAERGGLLVLPRREAADDALLAAAAEGAVMGREALTFAGLRGRVAEAAGIPEPEPAPRIELRIALREALEGVDLSPFGDSAGTPGFLGAIERALAELRGARVPPERVRAAATTPVTRALAEVHAAAWDRVPHPSDAAWEVVRAAEGVRGFPPVTVAGVDDLDPAEWALLRALGERGDVRVVLPHAPERAAHEARHARMARWRRDASVAEVDGEAPEGPRALARRLFEEGPPAGSDGGLRLVGAAGTRGMLRTALEEVLAAAAAGTPLSRIALVVPRLADLRDDLDRLLDDWGIPARRTTQVRVVEAPLALALTHLLRLGEPEPDAPGALDHLLGWLRTPYSGADPAEVDLFEAHARRASLDRRGELMGRWADEVMAPARRLVAAARQGPRAQIAALVEHGGRALRRAAAAGATPTRADLRDRAALSALAGLARAVGHREDDRDVPDDEPEARARGPLPPPPLGDLVADLTVTEREGPADGLDVHDLASLRGREYDVVVLAGIDGDGYPPGPVADPLLGALRAPLADALPHRAPGTSEGRLRFVHAVDAARDRLTVVRRLVDDEGREVAPSPYWVELARVAGRDPEALDHRTGARGEVADRPEEAVTEREALRALALAGGVAPGLLAEAAARRTRPLGVDADAFHRLARFRVTDLETYLRCPYGWFRDRVLQPQEIEPEMDVRFEGSLAHEILHRLYERMRAEDVGACTGATLARYREALGPVVEEVAAEWRTRDAGAEYDALVERMRRHLAAMLGREAARGSTMTPTLIEARMEDPTLLEGIAPGLVVSGQVDRLDVTPSGDESLVIDYKRRRGEFKKASEEVTDRLQLPLYGRMAAATEAPGARPVGGLYLGILTSAVAGAVRDDIAGVPEVPKGCRVSGDEWEALVAEAEEAARGAVRDIRAGRLAPPRERRCSPWCGCGDLWR